MSKIYIDTLTDFNPVLNSGESLKEAYIESFLLNEGISFEREVKITHLEGDDKSYRVVDFYLPKLGVYVEYLGLYNQDIENRSRYKKKIDVYIANKLPTIFIYPEELGILEFVFHVKALRLLKNKKFKLAKGLFNYRTQRFKNNLNGLRGFQLIFLPAFICGSLIWVYFDYDGFYGAVGNQFEFLIWMGTSLFAGGVLGLIHDVIHFYYRDR